MSFEMSRRGTRRVALVVGVSVLVMATLGTALAVAVRGTH
jgi:hypothetical protein